MRIDSSEDGNFGHGKSWWGRERREEARRSTRVGIGAFFTATEDVCYFPALMSSVLRLFSAFSSPRDDIQVPSPPMVRNYRTLWV
jgi:hypothetical protein